MNNEVNNSNQVNNTLDNNVNNNLNQQVNPDTVSQVVSPQVNLDTTSQVVSPQVNPDATSQVVSPQVNNVTAVNNENTSNVNLVNNPNGTIPPNGVENKKSKTPIFIIIGVVLVLVVVAVVLFFVLKGNKNDPKYVVEQYLTNILEKKYSDNYDLVLIPENNFVEVNEYVEHVQKQEKYQGLNGMEIDEIQDVLVSEENASYNVVLKNEEDVTKNVSISLKNNKKWSVIEDNLYVENWSIIVPKGTTIRINSKEVPKSLLVDDASIDKNNIKYVLPAITMVKKEFLLDHSLQKKTMNITPMSSNSGEVILIELTNTELVNKAHNFIKNTWNSMYKDYLGNVNVSDVANKYFVSSMSIDDVNTYYKKSFDEITKGSSGYKYENYNMANVIVNPNVGNYVINDDTITINFGYTLNWNWTFSLAGEMRTMKRYSKIRLKIDGDSFKIYEVPDAELFSYSNHYKKDF